MERLLPALLALAMALTACATADTTAAKNEALISDLWRSPRPAAR